MALSGSIIQASSIGLGEMSRKGFGGGAAVLFLLSMRTAAGD